MWKLSIKDIKQGYAGLKKIAQKLISYCKYEEALISIKHASILAQQFNWIYADDEIEDILKQISNLIIKKPLKKYESVKNRVVLYDEFCVSFVLSIQYLEALVAAGKEIVYIALEQNVQRYGLIFDYVRKLPHTKVIILKKTSLVETNQSLYDAIIEHNPEQLFLHIEGTSSYIPALDALPPKIRTYIINLADQTFWLGKKAVDYVLEFRQFGVSVSQQRRGIKPEQQLLVPFYPIIDNNPFQGFPTECTEEGKVLVFSGGDIYKVLDEKRMYWHLVKRLLDTFPEVVFLFATKADNIGMDFLQSFIKDNHYEGRFIYSKFRSDINEVLAHADIFMGTCPVCGSLMSQLAARNATPILQYYYPGTPDDETEQAICINEQFNISFNDEDAFMQEAERLIRDVEYRKKQGGRLQKAMITIPQFNKLVADTLITNETQISLQPYQFDYKQLDDRWFALENAGFIDSMNYIYGLLGAKSCLRYAPMLYIKKQINRLLKHFVIK